MIPVNTNFPDQIAAALMATFPDAGSIESVTVLREGFRNIVLETSGGDVFKIAKNWEASATYAMEQRVLPELGESLAAPIPYPLWYAGKSPRFPFGVLGYPKLAGTSLRPEVPLSKELNTLARDIARFMFSLHRVPVTDSLKQHLPRPDTYWYQLAKVPDAILPTLRELLSDAQYATVKRWWNDFLEDDRVRRFTPVVVHGDLSYDNILVSGDRSTVTGVVDFENLALGDPAQDFATQLHLGRDVAESVLEHYQAAGGILDTDVRYRMQKRWELRGFNGMQLAIHFEDQAAFDTALANLLNGPILNPTTRKDTTIWQPPRN